MLMDARREGSSQRRGGRVGEAWAMYGLGDFGTALVAMTELREQL